MAARDACHPAFTHDYYVFRRKILIWFGGAFHVYDRDGRMVLYSKQKPFKLKEDFRVYSDQSQSEELLVFKTPDISDYAATYTVQNPAMQWTIGSLKRKGLKSLVRSQWLFLSGQGREIGTLVEEGALPAFLRRLAFLPRRYVVTAADGTRVAEIRQPFFLFALKHKMKILQPASPVDRRLLVAAGILLCATEAGSILHHI